MDSNNNNFRDDIYNDSYIEPSDTEFSAETVVTKAPPREPERQQELRYSRPKKKKKKFFKKFLVWILCLLLVATAAFLTFAWIKTLFVPENTNLLIMATDEDGTRTDTLMLASFNKKTDEVSLISIPRDTYVTVSDESYSSMREDYPQPASKSMKINAVHHFAGEKNAVDFTLSEVGRLLNLDIDYYIKVDFDAFRYIIDSLGGIEFDVPRDMYYDDPYQDLHINLKKGLQTLDGEQAEHLLRYRSGYATADIGRVEVQQKFVKALISQTLSKGTILTKPKVIFDAIFTYDFLETNVNASDIATYAILAGGIDAEKITTKTLPGAPAMRGGQAVYLPNVSEIDKIVSEIIGD